MEYVNENERQDEVYSKAVKAGKRTYFFDIKSTRGNDLYITVTESKKLTVNGKDSYQKHKIFLYKEDFDKVIEALQETIDKTKELQSKAFSNENTAATDSFSDLSFEDL